MDSAPQATTSTPQPLLDVPYASTGGLKRRRRPWLVLGAVTIVLAASAVAVRTTRLPERVLSRGGEELSLFVVQPCDLKITLTEDGELKPKNSVEIKCEVEGQTTILWVVPESTQVKKGDLLVELASDSIKERLDAEQIEFDRIKAALAAAQKDVELIKSENDSRLSKCENDVKIAELELKRYQEGDISKSRNAIEINIKETLLDIERKEDELNKYRQLLKLGFVTRMQVKDLEFQLEKAKNQLAQFELQRQVLEQYEIPKNLAQRESALKQAQEELAREEKRGQNRLDQAMAKLREQETLFKRREERLARLRKQYENCKIYAPVDGVVQYPSDSTMRWRDSNRIAPGERVYEGQTLIVLPDTSQMVVETRIHEADRHKVREGLPCLIKVPAVPNRTFTGRITSIARFADTANRWLNPELKEHTTEILLDPTEAPISPGDSAEIKIIIDELKNVLAVPVQCVYSRGNKHYVFVQRDGEIEYVEVELGLASESMTEIRAGLKPGDQVLMKVDDKLVAGLPAPEAPMSVAVEPPPGRRSGSGAKPPGPPSRRPRPPQGGGGGKG